MDDVFELIEITDEMYFTQGMFESADLAIKAVKEDYPHNNQGSEVITWEIRKHQLNEVGHGNYIVTARLVYDSILESLRISYLD